MSNHKKPNSPDHSQSSEDFSSETHPKTPDQRTQRRLPNRKVDQGGGTWVGGPNRSTTTPIPQRSSLANKTLGGLRHLAQELGKEEPILSTPEFDLFDISEPSNDPVDETQLIPENYKKRIQAILDNNYYKPLQTNTDPETESVIPVLYDVDSYTASQVPHALLAISLMLNYIIEDIEIFKDYSQFVSSQTNYKFNTSYIFHMASEEESGKALIKQVFDNFRYQNSDYENIQYLKKSSNS